ncbi:AAA family ATPase [Gardnerella vaginalis]|nr:AAA family ATPase [Gardnerella vaginalis]
MKRMALFPPQPSKQNDNANTGVFNLPPQPRAVRPNNTMVSNTIANQIVDSINQPVSAGVSNEDIKRAQQIADILRSRFAQTLVGQDSLRESLILTLAAGGHILIESVPGLAKTTAAQTLATAMSGSFKRVQCTPDLMPADLVGTQVFDFASQRFTTQIGPIHANVILLDEINRSNAKTQSAMLEAMAEGATTIGGERINLPQPFMVIATQNPIEEEGTFNLPEAQMDRFMIKAIMSYPSFNEEVSMLKLLTNRGSDVFNPESLNNQKISLQDVTFLRSATRRVHVSEAVMKYAVDIVATSRGEGSHPLKTISSLVRMGASPRASIALIRIGQAQALLAGRDYVIPEDVKKFAHDVLRHRILLTFEALADSITSDQIIDAIVKTVPAP